MNEMLNYIFTNMDSYEKAIRSQRKFNLRTMIFTTIATLHVYYAEKDRLNLRKEIKRLSREIEELKQAKGE